jgi:hypothetical protein
MLVTDKPLEELKGNQLVLDGATFGMADVLVAIPQHESTFRGDACAVVTQLDILVKKNPDKDETDGE